MDVDTHKILCPYVMAEYMDFDYDSPRSFSSQQAEKFARLVMHLGTHITDLYVCCNMGESRSPAIAAAICRYFGLSDSHIWENPKYHPNILCFCRMLEALGLYISDEETDLLIETNRNAFKTAIRQTR